jgi:NADH-quinone oxidoreductase subunit J
MWVGPGILCLVLFLEVLTLLGQSGELAGLEVVSAKQVGIRLFGPYLLAVELASMLLMVGLVGAYHLGRPLKAADGEIKE